MKCVVLGRNVGDADKDEMPAHAAMEVDDSDEDMDEIILREQEMQSPLETAVRKEMDHILESPALVMAVITCLQVSECLICLSPC